MSRGHQSSHFLLVTRGARRIGMDAHGGLAPGCAPHATQSRASAGPLRAVGVRIDSEMRPPCAHRIAMTAVLYRPMVAEGEGQDTRKLLKAWKSRRQQAWSWNKKARTVGPQTCLSGHLEGSSTVLPHSQVQGGFLGLPRTVSHLLGGRRVRGA